MRVYGCLVYAHNNSGKGDKFGERGRRGIFVGYSSGQKGYRVYDAQTRNIMTSRDVTFFEHILTWMVDDTMIDDDKVLLLRKKNWDLEYESDEIGPSLENTSTIAYCFTIK